MMYGNGWDHMGGWGWFGLLFMLLFWFGLIALLIAALTGGFSGRGRERGDRSADDDRALAILRERFARGEITAEEYERARQVLDDRHR